MWDGVGEVGLAKTRPQEHLLIYISKEVSLRAGFHPIASAHARNYCNYHP